MICELKAKSGKPGGPAWVAEPSVMGRGRSMFRVFNTEKERVPQGATEQEKIGLRANCF